jgi:hypothetical protein
MALSGHTLQEETQPATGSIEAKTCIYPFGIYT